MNRLKKALALPAVGALMSVGLMAAPAHAAPAGPRFEQWAPCWPSIHVTNFNKRVMTIKIEGMDDVRVPANTGFSFRTDLDQLRWTAVVGKGKGADRAGKGVFVVNEDCPPAA